MRIVNIIPMAAPRPRFSKYGTYNTSKYTNWKKALQILLGKNKPLNQALHLEIIFYMPIPKMSKKKTFETQGKPHQKKPDFDNLVKAFCDGANGILWTDDNLVSSCSIKKIYSINPRIEFDIKQI